METNAYQQAADVEDVDVDDLFGGGEDEMEDNNTNAYAPAAEAQMPDVDEMAGLRAELVGEGDLPEGFDINNLNDVVLDIGEKADDAQDFEDIELSDEELPDDQPTSGAVGTLLPGLEEHAIGTIDFDRPGEDDDLFGDDGGDLFPLDDSQPLQPLPEDDDQDYPFDMASSPGELANPKEIDETDGMDEEELRLFRLQQMLFKGQAIPETEEENRAELLKLHFPDFDKTETPYFNRLFPPRPGQYMHTIQPPKRKPIRPTKVSLEIEQDQKTLFNSTATNTASDYRHDLVPVRGSRPGQTQDDSSDESDIDEPLPGGVTMQDLEFMCADFDTLSVIAGSDDDMTDLHTRAAESDIDISGTADFNDSSHVHKKRRTDVGARDIVSIYQLDLPSFDNPERATAKLSEKVILNLNDPQLLVEEIDPELMRSKTKAGDKDKGSGTLKGRLEERFKISNDAEYDLLKQNHQHKIRGQLGHLTIDHSTPALRLQYPYYKFHYDVQEVRNLHRKKMVFKFPVAFSKPAKHKRKQFKGKEFKEIYSSTKDLSLADNSTAILLEYSLENPMIMSQTGMGSKIVNYYRRKTKDDSSRPKHDLGETSVLLPEDKSPFYMFGHIDPGEEMTALYNSMYRAPIFEQDMQPRDFLVIRETTGMGGQHYYVRNVDHLFTVGQELPSTLIPTVTSRMVTTATKNRLKAISYRIARRKKHNRIRVEDVTKHFPDSNDMQNRQKMKEFMFFNKEYKEWEMKNGEAIPDEEAVRALIRPEDVCLLESTKVAERYLLDAGFEVKKEIEKDDDNDRDDDKDSIEQLLAPWRTSKTFLHATQGKAMIKVWGQGDPSGRGEAFSFIRTNMKGGYIDRESTAQDAIAKETKPGTHKYNVAGQQQKYEADIRKTWNNQKEKLGSKIEPSNPDLEQDVDTMQDIRARGSQRNTPVSTPAPARKQDHETATSFSKRSVGSSQPKFLRIRRTVRENGVEIVKDFIEDDPAVIKAYVKHKETEEAALESVYSLPKSRDTDHPSLQDWVPTGDAEADARMQKRQAPNIPPSTHPMTNTSLAWKSVSPDSTPTKPAASSVSRTKPAPDPTPTTMEAPRLPTAVHQLLLPAANKQL